LLAVWPVEAHRRGKGGRAVIKCKVGLQGSLFDCVVASEEPAGAGFGAAALTLTPQLLMTPALKDGKPIVGDVTSPINFPGFTVTKGDDDDFGDRKVVSGLPWRTAPSFADVAAAYPEKARTQGVEGHATLDCDLTEEAALKSCSVLSEEPKGYGFGKAARGLAPKFAGAVATIGGKSIEGIAVQLHFAFAKEFLANGQPTISKLRLAAAPTPEDFDAVFPRNTATAGVRSVRVVLICKVEDEGAFAGCAVEMEEPVGHDFGKGALAVASKFRVQVWSEEGYPVIGGLVRAPIRYEFGEPSPPPPKP
jgi:hypothetical protein